MDLRELEFPVGEIRLTGHHHVPSMLHRLGLDSFDLYVLSTYAHDQLSALLDAALQQPDAHVVPIRLELGQLQRVYDQSGQVPMLLRGLLRTGLRRAAMRRQMRT